jgi:hypothetical protein
MGLRWRRLGASIVLAMMVVGLSLLALAMRLYPGGTELDPHCAGHSFWFNLLCDLTGDRALNGAANPGGPFARAAMVAFSVGLGAFWLILPAEFPGHRGLATAVRVGGGISVLGFLAVPVASGALHPLAVFAAAVPGVLAALVAFIATMRYVTHKVLLATAAGSIATAAIDSVLYAQRVMDDYRTCPPSMPAFQRLTLLFVLAWAATTALRALSPHHPAGQGRRP